MVDNSSLAMKTQFQLIAQMVTIIIIPIITRKSPNKPQEKPKME